MIQAARAGTHPSTSAGYKASGFRSVYLCLACPRHAYNTAAGNYERKEILCKKKEWQTEKSIWLPEKILINALKILPPPTGSFWRTVERQELSEAFSGAEFIEVPRELLEQPEHMGLRLHKHTPLQRAILRELKLGSFCSPSKAGAAIPLRKTVPCKCIIHILALMGWKEMLQLTSLKVSYQPHYLLH